MLRAASRLSGYMTRRTLTTKSGAKGGKGAATKTEVSMDRFLYAPHNQCSKVEWEVRNELATAYQLAAFFGYDDIVWNHITARVPGEQFLINRFGTRYDEVCAENLIKLDTEGRLVAPGTAVQTAPKSEPQTALSQYVNYTGYVIHSAIHKARPDVSCVFHSHPVSAVAVSALDLPEPFMNLSQDNGQFYKDVAYYDYHGMSLDVSEQDQIVAAMGDKNVLVMRNHGITTVGKTVGEAFLRMHYFVKCCDIQMTAMSTGASLRTIPDAQMQSLKDQYTVFPPGLHEWPALVRMAEQLGLGEDDDQ